MGHDVADVIAQWVQGLPPTVRRIDVYERSATVPSAPSIEIKAGETAQRCLEACEMIANAADAKTSVRLVGRGKHGPPSAKPKGDGLAVLCVSLKPTRSRAGDVDDESDQSTDVQERRLVKIAIGGMQRMLETVTDTFAKTHAAMQSTMADLSARLTESEAERVATKAAADEAMSSLEQATSALEAAKAKQSSPAREMAESLLLDIGKQLAPDIADKVRTALQSNKTLAAIVNPSPTNGASHVVDVAAETSTTNST